MSWIISLWLAETPTGITEKNCKTARIVSLTWTGRRCCQTWLVVLSARSLSQDASLHMLLHLWMISGQPPEWPVHCKTAQHKDSWLHTSMSYPASVSLPELLPVKTERRGVLGKVTGRTDSWLSGSRFIAAVTPTCSFIELSRSSFVFPERVQQSPLSSIIWSSVISLGVQTYAMQNIST